jgi:hypothetical protein
MPTLDHVRKWQAELKKAGISESRPATPLLLPNYARQPYDYLTDYARKTLSAGQIKVA